jgi:hypothetical protein
LQSDPQPDLSLDAVSLFPLQHDEDFDLSQPAILHFVVSILALQPDDVLQQPPAFLSTIEVFAADDVQHLPTETASVVVFFEILFPSRAFTTRMTATIKITAAERPIITFFITNY